MKVISIVTQMEAAGAQRVAYMLHEQFQKAEHTSKLVFLYTKRPAYVGLPGVSSLLGRSPSVLEYGLIACKLAALLRAEKPDVLITHTHLANILGQSLGMVCGVSKRIAVNHGPECVYSPLVRATDRIAGSVGVYKEIVLVSDFVSNATTKFPSAYKKRISVIENGVSVSPVRDISTAQIRSGLGIPPTAPMLVNVGRLSRAKNQSLLLEVLTHLPEAHLVIAGDGELRDSLQSLADTLSVSERVHLIGELPATQVHAIVACSNVFVFPSTAESMGLALAEAMLLKKPIVASDIPVLADLLGDGGLLAPAENASAWADSIKRILSDQSFANTLGALALRKASQFSSAKMGSEYLALIST